MRVTKREEDIIEKMIDLSLSLNRSIEFLAGRLSLFSSSHLSHILAFARERSETRERERERDSRMSVTFPHKKLLFPVGRCTRKDGENTHKHTNTLSLSLSERQAGALAIGKNAWICDTDVLGAHGRRGSETSRGGGNHHRRACRFDFDCTRRRLQFWRR